MYNWNSMMKWSNKKLSKTPVYSVRDTIEKVISYIKEEYKEHPEFDEYQLKEYIIKKNYEEERECMMNYQMTIYIIFYIHI